MTAKTRKELGILAGLLVVLSLAIYWNFSPKTAEAPPAPSNSSADAKPKSTPKPAKADGKTGGAGTAVSVTDVKLDLLTPTADTYGAASRDPFRFRPKPSPIVRQAPPVVNVPPPSPVAVTPRQPERERIETLFKYYGYSVASGRPIAILSFGAGNANSPVVQVIGVEGDIIEGRYRLQRITPNEVEVIELNGNRRARIPKL